MGNLKIRTWLWRVRANWQKGSYRNSGTLKGFVSRMGGQVIVTMTFLATNLPWPYLWGVLVSNIYAIWQSWPDIRKAGPAFQKKFKSVSRWLRTKLGLRSKQKEWLGPFVEVDGVARYFMIPIGWVVPRCQAAQDELKGFGKVLNTACDLESYNLIPIEPGMPIPFDTPFRRWDNVVHVFPCRGLSSLTLEPDHYHELPGAIWTRYLS